MIILTAFGKEGRQATGSFFEYVLGKLPLVQAADVDRKRDASPLGADAPLRDIGERWRGCQHFLWENSV